MMQPKPKLYALALLLTRQARGELESRLQAGSCIALSAEQAIAIGHDLARRRWPSYERAGGQLSVSWCEIEIDARIREVVSNA